jgi:hypothetical protein
MICKKNHVYLVLMEIKERRVILQEKNDISGGRKRKSTSKRPGD